VIPGLVGIAGMVAGASGPAPGTLLVGRTTGNGTNVGCSVTNFMIGSAFQASASGIANSMFIRGQTGASSAVDHRLVIYAATSETVWSGAKLGETAVVNGLGINEVKQYALLSPVTIVAGNWYALCVHGNGNFACQAVTDPQPGGRFFADTFADGAAATAGASGLNSAAGLNIWVTT
jgi:hypothetical protein